MEFLYDKRHISNVFFGILIILGVISLGNLIRPVIGALGITIVLTYFLHPIVERLLPYVRWRWLSVLFTAFFIMVPLFIFFVILTGTVVSEILEITKAPQAEEIFAQFGGSFEGYLVPPPAELFQGLSLSALTAYGDIFSQSVGAFIYLIKGVGGFLLQMLLGMFFTVYILYKEEEILVFFMSIENQKIHDYILFVDEGLKQVVYSMFLTAIVTGLFATIIYVAFDVPYSILFGVTTGVVALIPILGTWLVYLPIGIYLYSLGNPFVALLYLTICAIVISTIPDLVIRPFLASKKVNMGLLILGFICGALVFGPAGILVGPLIIITWAGFIEIFLMEEPVSG